MYVVTTFLRWTSEFVINKLLKKMSTPIIFTIIQHLFPFLTPSIIFFLTDCRNGNPKAVDGHFFLHVLYRYIE